MQAGIKKVDDGLNRIDEYKLSIGVDGDDNIQDMGKLWVGRYGFILAKVNKGLMYPITNALQRRSFMIIFKYLQFQHLDNSQGKVSQVMVYMFIV